jgi:hypothetical protein
MTIPPFLRTIASAPYYRQHWIDAAREVYAAFQFRRHRQDDPADFLTELGINIVTAFDGFEKWRPTLKAALERVDAKGGAQGGCSLEDGQIFYGLVRALKPKIVIETGVAAGISTSFLGAALIENGDGRLYSVELPAIQTLDKVCDDGVVYEWASTGVGWAVPDEVRKGLGDRHTLVLEDVRTALPRLVRELPPIDIFIHDDLHTPDHMLWQYELMWPHLAPNGVMLSDDSNVGWVDFCKSRRLSDRLYANCQRLTAARKIAGALT